MLVAPQQQHGCSCVSSLNQLWHLACGIFGIQPPICLHAVGMRKGKTERPWPHGTNDANQPQASEQVEPTTPFLGAHAADSGGMALTASWKKSWTDSRLAWLLQLCASSSPGVMSPLATQDQLRAGATLKGGM